MSKSCHAAPAGDQPLREMLRHARLRVTAVRLAVLRVIRDSKATLDAQEILDRVGKRADRVTVYRNLAALVSAGLAHRVNAGDRRYRFGLTDHGRCTPEQHSHDHPHLVCDSCGTVQCLAEAEVVVRPRADTPRSVLFNVGVHRQDVTLHGTCGRCTDGDEKPRQRSR